MTNQVPSAGEIKQAFHEQLHPGRQSAVIAWGTFAGTFAAVRLLTHSIRAGKGPIHNFTPGGLHLHHYVWGIGLVNAVGGVALRGDDRLRRHPLLAVAYGAGGALIVDELALLLDLRDVYWTRQGRVSVDVAVGIIAAAGLALEGAPLWRELHRRRRQ